jgi:hypothetical protein
MNNCGLVCCNLFLGLCSYVLYVLLDEKIIMNDDLGRIWKEAAMAHFKVLFQNVLGGTRKVMDDLSE